VEQLTKIDFEMFSALKPVDFAEHIWAKDNPVIPINTWVDRFNQLSFWVATEICTCPLLKVRVQVLENMIKLLKVCLLYSFILGIKRHQQLQRDNGSYFRP
jgi:hypothetical protein